MGNITAILATLPLFVFVVFIWSQMFKRSPGFVVVMLVAGLVFFIAINGFNPTSFFAAVTVPFAVCLLGAILIATWEAIRGPKQRYIPPSGETEIGD